MGFLPGYSSPGAYEKITPGNSSTGITAAILQPTSGIFKGKHAVGALITVETNTVNVTLEGTAATAAAGTNAGHAMTDGQSKVLESPHECKSFRCIDRVSGSAGIVKVTTYF